MPDYLSPGVFVEEISAGPPPIDGVATGVAAFLGETERGPTAPRLVRSHGEFERTFGCASGRAGFLPHAVKGYFDNGGRRLWVCRVAGRSARHAERDFGDFLVRAAGPGEWGSRVWAHICPGTARGPDGQPVGFRLRLACFAAGDRPCDPFAPGDASGPQPFPVEDFDNLVVDPASPDYFGRRLPFIDLTGSGATVLPEAFALGILVRKPGAAAHARPAYGGGLLEGGTDDAPDVDAYRGTPPPGRTDVQGLAALDHDGPREAELIYAPAVADDVAAAIIGQCESSGYRFAIVDCPRGARDAAGLDPRRTLAASSRAASYYPWLSVADPQTGAPILVPPGGHVAGVFARVDAERGVFKAPANEVVRGALGVEFDIDDAMHIALGARGVNTIRRLPGRGMRIWGARTLSLESPWHAIGVRRLMSFLARSIDDGTQWTIFEPNDPTLWASVAGAIGDFLRQQRLRGAFQGQHETDAYFVRCDRTTMTQNDIDSGRLVCVIGVAPIRPAEFIVLRVMQRTVEA